MTIPQFLAKPFWPRSFDGILSVWPWLALTTGLGIAMPVLFVAGNLFVPSTELWTHLAETVLAGYVVNSLWLMLGVSFGVTIGGVGTAWLVTMCRFPGSRLLEWAQLLPLAMPAYVVAYAYTWLLDYAGPLQSLIRTLFGWTSARDYWFFEIRSLGGAILVMSLVLYPYVYLLARSAFLEQSVCVLEASRTLGQSPWRAFWRVALPLARPSIAAGVALALMETLNDFGTVHYFAVDTFTTGIYRTWLGMGQPAAAGQLGAVLMLFILGLLLLERFSRGAARHHHTTGRYRNLPKVRLTPFPAFLALAFCGLAVLLGFLIPAGLLCVMAIGSYNTEISSEFIYFARNSLILALITGLLAVLLALILGYAQRLHPTKLIRTCLRLSALGYAIPGSVIAIGILVPLISLDKAISTALAQFFGIDLGGLVLTGSIGALIYAYCVRFLAISVQTVEASLSKVTPSLEAAARTLGLNAFKRLTKVHMPVIRGSLLTAGLLVFVDVMKELPATLIMRPFNFDTLATKVFMLASDERLAEAAFPALAIVAVGLLPVVLLSSAIAHSRPGEDS
ncbi:MAG: iron ABC transporter permease [Rhodospirillales bacterium]|nr:iron ABC transporter permease [Rhodospirillales bacterium]